MDRKALRKLTSRLLRHSGFVVKMNKSTNEYEFFIEGTDQPILYCRPVIEEPEQEDGELEEYLCFRVLKTLSEEHQKIYDRMISRFTRCAPMININFENESEPIFTDEQETKLEELIIEYNKGDNTNDE